MPEFIMMVGLPGCGKSHFIRNMKKSHPSLFNKDNPARYVVLSSDDNITQLGGSLSYNEAFKLFGQKASEQFQQQLETALTNKMNIIVDRTNISKSARRNSGLELLLKESQYLTIFSKIWKLVVKCLLLLKVSAKYMSLRNDLTFVVRDGRVIPTIPYSTQNQGLQG